MRCMPIVGIALAALILSSITQAKIDLVTLPAGESTELTIYNSQDLTLAREARTLSFTEGVNEIQFSWSNTLIDPTSLQIDLNGAPGLTVLDAVYPRDTRELIVWRIEADEATSAPAEISYFTSGLTWSADYVIKTNADQSSFDLQQFTTVRNNSGADFEDAVTRVVVGEVNLIEVIADLARLGIEITDKSRFLGDLWRVKKGEIDAVGGMLDEESSGRSYFESRQAKEIITKAVSEYYVKAVEGKETILNGWGKRLPNPTVPGVPFDLSYEIDERRFGSGPVKIYKLRNNEDHELGQEPLPQGSYYVYADDGRGGLRFEGTTDYKYVPVGEEIELNLGSDGLVIYEQRTMSMSRGNFDFNAEGEVVGWEEKRSVEQELKNSRDRAVPVKLTHYPGGDWEFDSVSDANYTRVDRETVRWEIIIPARDAKTISYDVVLRHGSRAKGN